MVYPEEVEGPDYQARKIEPPAQTQTYKKKQKEGVSGGRDEKSEDITSHTSGTKSQNAKLLDASLLAASPKAGGAPANLPVVMDDENAGDGRVDDAPVPEKESDPRFEGEPTTEEYKRRLNELLRGKMI